MTIWGDVFRGDEAVPPHMHDAGDVSGQLRMVRMVAGVHVPKLAGRVEVLESGPGYRFGGTVYYESSGTFDKGDYPGLRAVRIHDEFILVDDLDASHAVDGGLYVPELTATVTNPTRHLQTGATVQGRYQIQLGICTVWVFIKNAPAVGTAGQGAYIVSLPVPADTTALTPSGSVGNGSIIGTGAIRDDDATGNNVTVGVQLRTEDSVSFPQSSGGFVSHNSPFTFAADDVPANFTAQYPVAGQPLELWY